MLHVRIEDQLGKLVVSFNTTTMPVYKKGESIFVQIRNTAKKMWPDVIDMKRKEFKILEVTHDIGKMYSAAADHPTREALSMTVIVKEAVNKVDLDYKWEGSYLQEIVAL
jgi:hypothetical protein